jgi:hypothetical protein
MNYFYSFALTLITFSNLFLLCAGSNDNATTTANERQYQADWYPFCGNTDADYGPRRFVYSANWHEDPTFGNDLLIKILLKIAHVKIYFVHRKEFMPLFL